MSTEYYIKHAGAQAFTVSKFDGGEAPLEVYNVDYSLSQKLRGKPASRCDCMAWRSGKRRPCKHIDMVALYTLRRGQYVQYLQRTEKWSFGEAAMFDFHLFVCEGRNTEWKFLRAEPQLKC